LKQYEVALYLQQRGLISGQAVVEGDLTIVDASRRNSNVRVISESGPCYLLKQAVGSERIATIGQEAAVYRLLSGPAGDGFREYIPAFHGYDPVEHVLALELLRRATSLLDYHRKGYFSTRLAAELGRALGTLHALALTPEAMAEAGLELSNKPHWILSVHRLPLVAMREISGADLQIVRIVQQYPDFCALLDELRADWQFAALIHADIKWSNCLAVRPEGKQRRTELKLVDWELATVGDPRWDVGSVFSDYLGYWLASIPILGDESPALLMQLARYPIEDMHPAIRAFWRAYVTTRELPDDEARRMLVESVRYAAARIVQKAYEQGQDSYRLTANIVCYLQLSLNMMRKPAQAVEHLLGISLEEPVRA
jgi:hypothetical protein